MLYTKNLEKNYKGTPLFVMQILFHKNMFEVF